MKNKLVLEKSRNSGISFAIMGTTKQTTWQAEVQYQNQKAVVTARNEYLSRFRTKADFDRYEADAFEDLKKLCPEQLVPVIFISEASGPAAGFLMNSVGNGGHRILKKMREWEIVRIKKSAILKAVQDSCLPAFNEAVVAQEIVDRQLHYLTQKANNRAIQPRQRVRKA